MVRALEYARRRKVIVFAAASNSGNRERIAFPACEEDCVICMNSTDGTGTRSRFNPQQMIWKQNFSILGEYVKSTWLQKEFNEKKVIRQQKSAWKRQQGTSVATTIAACVAVLIVQFGRQYGCIEKLETPAGIRLILRKMTENREDRRDGFCDIVPWSYVFDSSVDGGIDEIRRSINRILKDT